MNTDIVSFIDLVRGGFPFLKVVNTISFFSNDLQNDTVSGILDQTP